MYYEKFVGKIVVAQSSLVVFKELSKGSNKQPSKWKGITYRYKEINTFICRDYKFRVFYFQLRLIKLSYYYW